jgi:hypothetical protein
MIIVPDSGPSLLSQMAYLVSAIVFCFYVWVGLREKKGR